MFMLRPSKITWRPAQVHVHYIVLNDIIIVSPLMYHFTPYLLQGLFAICPWNATYNYETLSYTIQLSGFLQSKIWRKQNCLTITLVVLNRKKRVVNFKVVLIYLLLQGEELPYIYPKCI